MSGITLAGFLLLLIPGISNAADCISCHNETSETPGLYKEWNQSQHGQNNVSCLDCHQAESTDVDAYLHQGETISIIVSPKDCARCHETEAKEFEGSHHSRAGSYIPPEKNSVLGQTVGGHAAVVAGCEGCHGSMIEISNGRPDKGWPNTGIGRINPDGSLGACTACHGRHSFSVAQARTPEACAKCHIGPDHPQVEVYNESMHGIIYRAKINEMNLDSKPWIAGVDYSAAPTCATCHQSATLTQPATHDIGERLSWNLRAKISDKKNLVRLDNGHQYDVHGENTSTLPKVGDTVDDPISKADPKPQAEVIEVLTWKDRRDKMQNVCKACHTRGVVDGHYRILDDLVVLYNEKFAKPVSGVMAELADSGLITPTPFDEWIEWLWWETWHHEGRRARSGAAMGGPDYAWWHGIYDVAKRVYMEFIPELEEVAGQAESDRLLTQYFKPLDDHDWFFNAIRPRMENIVVVNLQNNQSQELVKRVRFQPTVTEIESGLEIGGPFTVLDTNELPLVGSQLIGQTVKMIVVVVSSDKLYTMSDSNGQLSAWDGKMDTLSAFPEGITLVPTQKVNILSGKMSIDGNPVTGATAIYLGFRIGDILLYFTETIDVKN